MQDCAEAVAEDMVDADVTEGILVGHSVAGVTVPRVLALVPDRVRAAVLVSAIVPPHGGTVMAMMDPTTRAAVVLAIDAGIYRPGTGAGLQMLCNDLDDAQTRFVAECRAEDSVRLLIDPVDLSGLQEPVPRWYVHLSLDLRVPPVLQDECNVHWGGERAWQPDTWPWSRTPAGWLSCS